MTTDPYDIRCQRCGTSYPSPFHFSSPGICTACFQKLPPSERAALPTMPGAHTGVDVPKLAHSYRRLVLWFGAQLVVNALSLPLNAMPAPGPGAAALSVIHLVGLLVTIAALSLYAHRIASASASKVPVLWAVAMLIPCLNGITLLALSARATNVCRAAGIPVGLLGPRLPAAPPPAHAANPS